MDLGPDVHSLRVWPSGLYFLYNYWALCVKTSQANRLGCAAKRTQKLSVFWQKDNAGSSALSFPRSGPLLMLRDCPGSLDPYIYISSPAALWSPIPRFGNPTYMRYVQSYAIGKNWVWAFCNCHITRRPLTGQNANRRLRHASAQKAYNTETSH